MKPLSIALKGTNITFSLEKVHTSFLLPAVFHELLGDPLNFLQVPNFGMLDFKNYNLVVDVTNKRIMLNQKEIISMQENLLPELANMIRAIETIEIITIGFNYAFDLAFDSDYGIYASKEFLQEKYMPLFGSKLTGLGIKAYVQEEDLKSVVSVEPDINDATHAVATANYHYTNVSDMNIKLTFAKCYTSFEDLINGIFTE
jgi:hypothetical protein